MQINQKKSDIYNTNEHRSTDEKQFMRLGHHWLFKIGMQVMEQAARKSSTSHAAVGRITTWQGYPFLQLPASSCDRAVAQLSGGRFLGSHS